MITLNKDEQLKLFSETAYQVSHEPVEYKRFELLTNAFQKMLPTDFRWRVGKLVEGGKVIAFTYGFGNYGDFDITQIRYRADESSTNGLFQGDESIFFGTTSTESQSINKSLELNTPAISFIQSELFRNGTNVGIATFDCPGYHLFSRYFSEALDPYKHLIVLALDSFPVESEDDVMTFVKRTKRKQIIVLGKDSDPETVRLDWISTILRELGYNPIIVKQQPDIPELSNEEKVRVLMDTSRFAIIENSFPAGQIAELKICSTNRVITACLRESMKGSSWMVGDYPIDFNFINEFEYDGTFQSLQQLLKTATAWAENKIKERADYFRRTYPTRAIDIVSSS